MIETFTMPSSENVQNSCTIFDNWPDNPDSALAELFGKYPENIDPNHVLLKVVALNDLYSTQIPVFSSRVPTVFEVARHIVDRDIDAKLAIGSEDLVHQIAYIEAHRKEKRFNYSFATKYCNWHQPDFYPIWDSRVDAYLWKLRNLESSKPGGFRKFNRKELWQYPTFKRVVTDLKTHFQLEGFNFKQIDKFLYSEGRNLFA